MELLVFAVVVLLALAWMLEPLLRAERDVNALENGEPAGPRCGGCGAPIVPSARFCAGCGRTIGEPPADH